MPATLSLPDLDALDPAALKAMILAQQDHYKAQHETYTATLSSRATEIDRLKLLVDKLQRMLFGAKSEKVLRQIEQLELQLEELGAAEAIEEKRATPPVERPVAAKPFSPSSAGASSARGSHPCAPSSRLPRLRRETARARRGCRRDAGVRPRLLQGHPSCSPEAELRWLRPDRVGSGAVPAHRSWPRRSRSAGSCAGRQVCGLASSLPPVRDLQPRGRRPRCGGSTGC